MSSSQNQPMNSNSNNTNQSQIPTDVGFEDYEEYPSLNNQDINDSLNDVSYDDHVLENIDKENVNSEDDTNIDEIYDALLKDNEDESIYSDEVQKAFNDYEKANSQYWPENEPGYPNFLHEEYDDILNEMAEAEYYMNEEYVRANRPFDPEELAERSTLNVDAVEFQPSYTIISNNTDVSYVINEHSTNEQ